MFMITAVQVQAFRATGDRKYVDRAALAMVAYLDRLQQPNGLFFHAPDSQFYWSRGNGWMAAGSAELLRSLPEAHPARPRILEGYRRMMASLLADAGRGRPVAPVDRSPGGVARNIGHGHVRLRDGHGRPERVARRADVRAGGAQGLAGPREVHRRRRQHQQRLRGHQQGPDGAGTTWTGRAIPATCTARPRCCGPRRRCCAREAVVPDVPGGSRVPIRVPRHHRSPRPRRAPQEGLDRRRSRQGSRDGVRLRPGARAQARDRGRRPQALGAAVRRRQRRQHQLPPDRRLGALHAHAHEQGRPARRGHLHGRLRGEAARRRAPEVERDPPPPRRHEGRAGGPRGDSLPPAARHGLRAGARGAARRDAGRARGVHRARRARAVRDTGNAGLRGRGRPARHAAQHHPHGQPRRRHVGRQPRARRVVRRSDGHDVPRADARRAGRPEAAGDSARHGRGAPRHQADARAARRALRRRSARGGHGHAGRDLVRTITDIVLRALERERADPDDCATEARSAGSCGSALRTPATSSAPSACRTPRHPS